MERASHESTSATATTKLTITTTTTAIERLSIQQGHWSILFTKYLKYLKLYYNLTIYNRRTQTGFKKEVGRGGGGEH